MSTFRIKDAEYYSPAAEALLAANRLTSFEDACRIGEVMHRRYDAKAVAAATLFDGDQPVTIYIKKQWRAARLIPRMHAFLSGKAFWSYPRREWWGILRLRELGLDTAEPLALFRHPWHPFRAAVITRAVPGQWTLVEMLQSGVLSQLTPELRSTLAGQIVRIIETIHGVGLGWRSMDIKHFYPVQQENGSWRIWLIDCEGIFSPLQPRHRERERRSVIAAIRWFGSTDPAVEDFVGPIEQRLLMGLPETCRFPEKASY